MFERYTIEAGRVIFFARAETSRLGSPSIQVEHLALALLIDSVPLVSRFIALEEIPVLREAVERTMEIHEPTPTSVDLPMSQSAKEALKSTEKLAEDHRHSKIRPIHVLAALVTMPGDLAGLLTAHGIGREAVMALLLEDSGL